MQHARKALGLSGANMISNGRKRPGRFQAQNSRSGHYCAQLSWLAGSDATQLFPKCRSPLDSRSQGCSGQRAAPLVRQLQSAESPQQQKVETARFAGSSAGSEATGSRLSFTPSFIELARPANADGRRISCPSDKGFQSRGHAKRLKCCWDARVSASPPGWPCSVAQASPPRWQLPACISLANSSAPCRLHLARRRLVSPGRLKLD